MGTSNPCLTFLLVYSAAITIALIITGALLGTTHNSVVCAEGDTGVQVTHYSIVDDSKDIVEGDGSVEPVNCHCNHTCNCRKEELEIFLLTGVGILILALTAYTCVGVRMIILKRKKLIKLKKTAEQERINKENELKEIEKRREWCREAMEIGALSAPPAQSSKGAAKAVPKDLE